MRRLSKEGGWILLGQGAAVAGSLFGVRLITGLLSPAGYGELALGMTVATLVNQALLGPLGNGVTRFFAPAQERGQLLPYVSSVYRLTGVATLFVVGLALVAAVGMVMTGEVHWIGMTVVASMFALFSGYNSILSGMQNAGRQRSVVALHQGIEPWARFSVAALMISLIAATSTSAMLGFSVAALAVLCSQWIFFRRIVGRELIEVQTPAQWRGQIWHFSWPIALFGIFSWVQLSSDRWALGLFAGTSEVGKYAVLNQLGYYPVSLLSGMAMQLLIPILYQRAGDASDDARNMAVRVLSYRVTYGTIALTFIASAIALVAHKQIFALLAAKEYRSVSYLLPLMVMSGGIFAAAQSVAAQLMSQMKTRDMILPKIATSLLGVACNYAGAYLYGTPGVVMAVLIFSVSYLIWMALLSHQHRPKTGVISL